MYPLIQSPRLALIASLILAFNPNVQADTTRSVQFDQICPSTRIYNYFSSQSACPTTTHSEPWPYTYIPRSGSTSPGSLSVPGTFSYNGSLQGFSLYLGIDYPACSPYIEDISSFPTQNDFACMRICASWNSLQEIPFYSGYAFHDNMCWLKNGLDEMTSPFELSSSQSASAGIVHLYS